MTLIFDFNGTLLNDVDVCFNILNEMLEMKNHRRITMERYKEIFGFPIMEYYKRAGFVFPEDNYDDLAKIFMKKYMNEKHYLYNDVTETLKYLNKKYKLVVLSSSSKDILEKQLKELKIFDMFSEVIGNDNICGLSKLENGILYRKKHIKEDIIVIGDTDHDHEVAKNINAKCILVSFGHQRRNEKDVIIINDFKELKSLF